MSWWKFRHRELALGVETKARESIREDHGTVIISKTTAVGIAKTSCPKHKNEATIGVFISYRPIGERKEIQMKLQYCQTCDEIIVPAVEKKPASNARDKSKNPKGKSSKPK